MAPSAAPPARPEPPGGGAGFAVPPGYPVAGYRVGELIGVGGWGSVYAARREGPGSGGGPGGGSGETCGGGSGGPSGSGPCEAAVKFLHPGRLSPGQRDTMLQLAHSELRFSRSADHPHLIRTLAAVTLADPAHPALDGALALVMERAAGSLQDLLAATRPSAPVPDAGRILAEVAAGLRHMHTAGWVHGDLKPANVLLMPDGTAKLADFGLTAELDGTHAYAPPLGSPDHVPPEWWSQRTGAHGVALRPSADLWAFGVLAHQLLTGGLHPFLGATARARSLAALAYARGSAPLRLDAALPERWRPLVGACLTADRRRRAEVDLAALLAVALDEDVPPAGGAPVRLRRRRTAVGATALLTGAAVLLALTGAPEPAGPTASGSSGSGSSGSSGAPPPVRGPVRPGAIPPGADVPAALRAPIDDAARRCPEAEVTPVLLAAMIKAESGFDPAAARPETGEYGVAMWTPSVFNAWAQDADHDGVKDYLDPDDAIAAMGGYVCWLAQRFKQRGYPAAELPALVTAGYRTSDKTVADAGGVPDRVKPHVSKVLAYLAEYGGTTVAGS
ncbi:serine/threonine-protein kinase [Kitasatospora sp. NPDC058032]|uniref:serine/threonine-protein kinase n=1 Tax=Kitasatospora sp. NPDC058032 TaxID=3346307 RepID=UPI0036DAE671